MLDLPNRVVAPADENKDPSRDALKDPGSAESKQVAELRQRDREVRTHEQAHVAGGGQHVTGGPTYSYQKGPDGRRYAVGGEVQIDTSPIPGDPEATLRKMQQVQRAALAPAEPSAQDRAVAAQAAQQMAQARIELQRQRAETSGADAEKVAPPDLAERLAPPSAEAVEGVGRILQLQA
jgi:hypothetical protein